MSPNRRERKVESVAGIRTVDSSPCEPTYSVHDGGVFNYARTLTMAYVWHCQLVAAVERRP